MKFLLIAIIVTLMMISACTSTPTSLPMTVPTPTRVALAAPTVTTIPSETLRASNTSTHTATAIEALKRAPMETATVTPTATFTQTPTATVPSIPKAEVAGLDIDQRPPLDLANQTIATFAKAVRTRPEAVNLIAKQLKDKQGKAFLVAISSDTSNPLAAGVPLLIAEQKEGVWEWRPSGLDALSEMIGIPFGVALWYKDNTGTVIKDARYDQIVKNDFSLATIGAGVGWKWLEPSPGNFDSWSLGDMSGHLERAESFANLTNLRLHAVLWPEQYPDWLGNLSADDASTAMLRRIEYLADRYKGRVQEVVVINEPYYSGPLFTSNGSFTRQDALFQKLGQNYLVDAFSKARELFGPDVKLIYNDTANHSLIFGPNGGYTKLTQRNIALLAQQGLIDYVGLQTHIDAQYPPSEEDMIQAIKAYRIPVVITELDVRLDHLPASVSESDRQQLQAQIYARVIEAAVRSSNVKEISIYDAGDKFSWFDQWANSPDANATLFDQEFNPKPSYYALLKELLHQILLAQSQ